MACVSPLPASAPARRIILARGLRDFGWALLAMFRHIRPEEEA